MIGSLVGNKGSFGEIKGISQIALKHQKTKIRNSI